MAEIDITIQTYDQIATAFADRWWNVYYDQALGSFCSRLRPGARLLDLGCGPGRDVELLSTRGYDVIGLDRSQGMLREAQRRVGGAFAGADMRKLPLASASLDGVWLCASLLHLPRADALPTMTEIRRVLQDRGVLYVSVLQGEGARWTDHNGLRYYTYYRLEELRKLAAEAGYRVPEMWLNAPDTHTWINLIAVK